ncbi:MAG: leucine-rich repeat domain-containing protein [Deltaproteobacteria bacterium]|nr:leucine-rich repeat domain-containing protein [Deltaproteobacteria bacterium]
MTYYLKRIDQRVQTGIQTKRTMGMTVTAVLTISLLGLTGCAGTDDSDSDGGYYPYDPAMEYYSTPEGRQCAYEECNGGWCEWNDHVFSCSHCPANRTGASCEILPRCVGVVEFGSSEVESAVRTALNHPEADIIAADLRRLETLTVVGTRFDTRDDCTESCEPYPYRDLTGLHCATNLRELHLNNVADPDVTPLAQLTQLQLLEIGAGSDMTSPVMLERMSVLSQLPELRTLLLSGVFSAPDLGVLYVPDISVLSSLVKLTTLKLDNNQIVDVSPLGTLVNLTSLVLENNDIRDVSGLSTLIGLTSLDLQHNRISDVSGLSTLLNLTDLSLNNNEVHDVNPLSMLVNLTSLNLSGNRIRGVSGLSPLVNLTSLNLEMNAIVNVSGLSTLENLTALNLHANSIFDVSGLSTLVHLTALDLSSNPVRSIRPLATLVNLNSLNIDNGTTGPDDLNFSDVSPLSGLLNLATLDLSGNRISDVSPLSSLVNLTQLDLRNTLISDVTPLSPLLNLRELFIDVDTISDLSPLSSLVNLTINPNP